MNTVKDLADEIARRGKEPADKAEDLSSILRTREEGFCFHLYICNVSSVCAYTITCTQNKNARKKFKILKLSKLTELRWQDSSLYFSSPGLVFFVFTCLFLITNISASYSGFVPGIQSDQEYSPGPPDPFCCWFGSLRLGHNYVAQATLKTP